MDLTTIALLILVPVLAWRIYTRVKSRMERQRSIVSRHYTGLLVFFGMVAVPASEMSDPLAIAALAAGTVAGLALGAYGLRLTRFEETEEGYFFTPNARLGVLIAMALVARVLYLGVLIYANKGSNMPTPRITDSPLTMLTVGLAAGYFWMYSLGLLRWRMKVRNEIGTFKP
ncbi:hypothetical protein GCM10027321_22710 [Massilia terrae]|uniref:DUF1453 domain-containing protein n=1 Tax=Massilia terrae TaxID=1811224 RepID=A0ABT2CX69_9BURK|nr:hypothetical protein [Massilia terrae]MCS0658578.1 hypothetical protein [Massilia terrae]